MLIISEEEKDCIMSKKALFIWVFFVFLGIFCIKVTQKPILRIIMCDVGQGDAYVVSYKRFQMVIDGGPNRKVLECIESVMPIFDKNIEYVLATHPDKDHIAGLTQVLTRYKVDHIISNGRMKQTKTFLAFQDAISTSKAEHISVQAGDQFSFESVLFSILWPEENIDKSKNEKNEENKDQSSKTSSRAIQNIDDTNGGSIVLRLEFGAFSALFIGDLEIPQENRLVSSGALRPVTLLKVGHHGSTHSTSPVFLEKLQPKYAFIGVGKNNTYGHPTKRVLDLLEENRVKIYRSDRDGQVILESDGKSLWEM